MTQVFPEQIPLLSTDKDKFYAYLRERKDTPINFGAFSVVANEYMGTRPKATLFIPTNVSIFNDPNKVAVKAALARVYFPPPHKRDKWENHVRWGVRGPRFIISNLQLNRGIRIYMFYPTPGNKGWRRRDVTHRPLELSELLRILLHRDVEKFSNVEDETGYGLHYRAAVIMNALMPRKLQEWGYTAPDFYPLEPRPNSWWGYSYYSRVYPILGQMFEHGHMEKIDAAIRANDRSVHKVNTHSLASIKLLYTHLHDSDAVGENYIAAETLFFSEDMGRMGKYLRKSNLKELCVALFGKKATKPVVKIVGQILTNAPSSHWNMLIVASRLKYFFEPDQLVEFLKHASRLGTPILNAWSRNVLQLTPEQVAAGVIPPVNHIGQFKEMIADYTPQRILQLIKTPDPAHFGNRPPPDDWTHHHQEILDTTQMYSQIKAYEANQDEIHRALIEAGVENVEEFTFKRIAKPKTFKELHDALTLQAALIKEIPRVIDQEPYNGLHGCVTWNGLRIETPRITTQMKLWGTQMNHCIGSYTNQAVGGTGLYFAVYDQSGQLIANAELRPTRNGKGNGWHISQFLGRHNAPQPIQVVTPVMEVLYERELILPGDQANLRFWGAPTLSSENRRKLTHDEGRSAKKVIGLAHNVPLKKGETFDSPTWLTRVMEVVEVMEPAWLLP